MSKKERKSCRISLTPSAVILLEELLRRETLGEEGRDGREGREGQIKYASLYSDIAAMRTKILVERAAEGGASIPIPISHSPSSPIPPFIPPNLSPSEQIKLLDIENRKDRKESRNNSILTGEIAVESINKREMEGGIAQKTLDIFYNSMQNGMKEAEAAEFALREEARAELKGEGKLEFNL